MADNAVATADNANAARFDLRGLAQTPAARQLLLLIGVAAAVALGVAVVLWSRNPDYGLLYGNLSQKDAATMAQALHDAGTPYRVSNDGSSVFVPADQVGPTRLKMAAQGLPEGTAQATADAQSSPFGMSDMAERKQYQNELEGDLGSTIASLQSIKSARVHLALPKPSAFIRDAHPASASVVVSMYSGRRLDQSQVAAIVHLIAASVPELDPRQVSVIDQQGQLLTVSDPDSAAAISDTRMRLSSRIESTYTQRVEELLTPLVGAGRVRAQVFADVDFSQIEKASETFGHDKTALRSEQVSSQETRDGSQAGAVPGALSNQPPNAPVQASAAGAGNPGAASANSKSTSTPLESSNSATRNYEVDRTISHVRNPAGRIARLTVAVVVDNKQVAGKDGKFESVPFTTDELSRLTELTKNAVGFDAKRGDSVSVINEAFRRPPEEADPPGQPFWMRPGVGNLIKQGLGVLMVLALAFGLLRPLMRSLLRPGSAQPRQALPSARSRVEANPELPMAEKSSSLPAPTAEAYQQKVGIAKRLASENPKQVAQVVKNWVSADGV